MRSIIREGSRLTNVVMLGSDFYEGEQLLSQWEGAGKDLPALGIGKNCKIERAIIDKNVRIGDGVSIRAKPEAPEFQGKDYWIREGITVIPKGAIIKPGSDI
jgi:glucose-1-phosphate adenylyltransferase